MALIVHRAAHALGTQKVADRIREPAQKIVSTPLAGNSTHGIPDRRGLKEIGRNVCATLLIVDAQSVKNTGTATLNQYDAGKKVSGTKRGVGE